jgi:hypothetical protein
LNRADDAEVALVVLGKSVQDYNAQVVASPEQVIVAAEVTQSHNDADHLEPMVAEAVETPREAGIEEPIGIVLADGGYWNSSAISEVRRQGIDVLVPTEDRRRTAPSQPLTSTRTRNAGDRGCAVKARRAGALPSPSADRRTRLRAHEGHPAQRPLPPTRPRRLPGGVATDRCHP